MRLANNRVVETINSKRTGGILKKRDTIMGFDITGIIKLLSNKTKMISLNLIPIIREFFTSAEEFILISSNRDVDGRIRGLSGDLTPADLTVILNGMSRYNIKIKPEFLQVVSMVLDPA